MNKTKQLTREGYDNLKAELNKLKTVKRPKTLELLQKARAMGDLSENSAYHSARESLSLVEGRIKEIEEIIRQSTVVDTTNNISRVFLGSTVIVQSNGVKDNYKIVGEFEADPMSKKISLTSPLGKGFLGKKVGDTVEIKVPSGIATYKILAIG